MILGLVFVCDTKPGVFYHYYYYYHHHYCYYYYFFFYYYYSTIADTLSPVQRGFIEA